MLIVVFKKQVWLLLALIFIGLGEIKAQPGKKIFHKSITNLSTSEFAKNLNNDKVHSLLDVRSKQEFEEGHLPNALNIDVFDEDFKSKTAKLDKSKPIFVYCYSGGRSEEASDILAKQGFEQIINLNNGFRGWEKAGMEVVK